MTKSPSALRSLGTVGSVGFAFVIAIALGWWVGSILDGWLGTSPWLTFVFFFFGVAAGVANVFRTVKAFAPGSPGGNGRD